jgi:hypothetical protein
MTAYSRRPRDFPYLCWIKAQQCVACEALRIISFGRIYAHHAGQRGLSQKAEDRTAIPLCWRHHDRKSPDSVHTLGKMFWVRYGLDRAAVIADLNERYANEAGWREAA